MAGVPTAAWGWVAYRALRAAAPDRCGVLVAPEPSAVDDLAAMLQALMPDRRVMVFPAWDVQPYDRMSAGVNIQAQRLAVLAALKHDNPPVVVSSINALGIRVPHDVHEGLTLARGAIIPPDTLARTLVDLGYITTDQVGAVGEWARRGGVVDIWPAGDAPVRLEFFDDEIDRLVTFDATNQRAVATIDTVTIGQAREIVLTPDRITNFRTRYRDIFTNGMNDDAYHTVSEGQIPDSSGHLLPLFWSDALPTFIDMLPDNTVWVVPFDLSDQARLWEDVVTDAYAAREEVNDAGGDVIRAVPPDMLAVPAAELERDITAFARVAIGTFDDGSEALRPNVRANDLIQTKGNRHAAATAAASDIQTKLTEGYAVVMTSASAAGLNQMLKALESEGAPTAALVPQFAKAVAAGNGVWACVAPVQHGWCSPLDKLLVLTEGDVFGARLGGASPRRKRSTADMIAHFAELRDGDYVVHEDHGVGRFTGLVTMDIGGQRQDFLKVMYAGDDRLFVPVVNLDVLSRYKGADAGEVTLDKLGGTSWGNRKAKVKEELLAMAESLLATAAARELITRPPLLDMRDEGLYAEFCAGFPYELTDDQARVMDEVEADLSANTPMDRLVVGDVGFGKTEVAIRAAYLAASAGKQVAIVCPTTLLARQHFDVFTQRFAGFPLHVGRLSRLVPPKEIATTKQALTAGTLDIVVGTHALLSKDIRFHNLGLVIIDEEQRFGVAHKERLKELRANVDVITLTATPIPRTLQMAIGGVRQLSLITTPPVDRHAVNTFVLPWDTKTLGEGIKRELGRSGQVYVVAPHIEDLEGLRDSVVEMAPNARVAVAHGQMAEGALEPVMVDFYDGKIDVLVATTIIESGLDVPKANTMIVYKANMFGLAQLYQLRGRVGRSTQRAYAYFVMPPGPMSSEAVKRLTILQRLNELGAGFTLASYDMDIRGFGNLLGKQQSGHIRDVGFELYNKMLKDAVNARQAAHKPAATATPDAALRASSVTLKLGLTYLIPDTYIPDVAERLQVYRRLANVTDTAGLADFRTELTDRCGPLPAEVDSLLAVMELRNRAEALNISRIDVGDKGVVVAFENGAFANPQGLMQFIMKNAGVVTVRPDQSLIFHRRVGGSDDVLGGVGVILTSLEKISL